MAASLVPSALQYLWNAWNIRGVMVLSLSAQLVLALAAPFRKRTSDRFTIFVVWSTYLLSDWAPVFAFGLISSAGCRNLADSRQEVPQDVMAFWASFLLIHLGSPDAITAFSLEDKALWPRHLVGLIAQLFTFLYIFTKTLPNNRLLAPTVLIFVAGVIKYGERTRALYLASLENLKKSVKRTPGEGDDDKEARFTDEMRPAFHFHRVFKGLVVDIMPSLAEWHESREFFLNKDAHDALRLMMFELSFLYDVLYTKIIAVNSCLGVLACSVAYCNVLVAFILFCLVKKDGFSRVDVAISYSLLAGVFALDAASGMMAALSHWTMESAYLGCQIAGMGVLPFLIGNFLLWVIMIMVRGSGAENLATRLWSQNMGSFNLLSYCFEEHRFARRFCEGFIREKLAEMRHVSKEYVAPQLWRFIFEKLRARAAVAVDADAVRRVRDMRGDGALGESGRCRELTRYINDYEYDDTLLLWHVATEICYRIDEDDNDGGDMRLLSKMLSDYLLYLLRERPKMMSAVAGISHLRYDDTIAEAKEVARKNHGVRNMLEFCISFLEEQTNVAEPVVQVQRPYMNSVLHDSCDLARLLRQTDGKWMVISKVWVDMLLYAACHCRADSHARSLSEGGDLVTFVWLLMAPFGMVPRFPVK